MTGARTSGGDDNGNAGQGARTSLGGCTLSLVVAMAENGVIGKGGALPWRLPSDLKHFRALTLGKPVIMGRKTFQSIGKPLEQRENIVITRYPKYGRGGVWTVDSAEEALEFGRRLAEELGADEIMVIGGGQVYEALIGRADRIYLTVVHAAPDGDVRLSGFVADEWRECAREHCPAGEGDDHDMTFVTLERR